MLFQGQWLAGLNRSVDSFAKASASDPVKNLYLPMGVGFLCTAMALYVLVHFLTFIKGGLAREGAIAIVFWGWLAFSALPAFSALGWTHAPMSFYLITQGGRLVAMLVAALTYVELSDDVKVKSLKKAAVAAAAAVTSSAETIKSIKGIKIIKSPKSPKSPRTRSRSPRTRSAKKL